MLFAAALAASTFCASAQNSGESRVKHGVRAGLNFDALGIATAGVSAVTESKVGFHLGYSPDISLGRYFAFQPAVVFTTRGGVAKEGAYEEKDNLYFLEVPLVFSLRVPFGDDGWFKWNILQFGPSIGVGLFGHAKIGDEKSKDLFSEEMLTRFNWGLTFGSAFEFGDFYVGGRYYLGLSNAYSSKITDNIDIVGIYGSFLLTLGWNF